MTNAYPYGTPVPSLNYAPNMQVYAPDSTPDSNQQGSFVGPYAPSYYGVQMPAKTPVKPPVSGNPGTGSPTTGILSEDPNKQIIDPTQVVKSWEDQQRDTISSGYNDYFKSLDSMMSELPSQAANQSTQVNASYNTAVGDVDAQNAIGVRDLANSRNEVTANQTSNLRSLADSLRNQFLQGQVMLGQRGAGDSSAANMYSYALTKLGSKQRTGIMNQSAQDISEIADREYKLQTTVNQEKNRLRNDRDTKLSEVAQWLSSQQSQVRQWIGEGQLRKSQDIAAISQQALNTALSLMSQAKAEYNNRRSSLETWAMNISTNINQLKSNLSQLYGYNPSMPQFSPIKGTPTIDSAGNMTTKFGANSYFTDDEKKQLGL